MPLQFAPLPPVDAELDPDAREERQRHEKLCAESRRKERRKYLVGLTILGAFGVVAAFVLARVMQGG